MILNYLSCLVFRALECAFIWVAFVQKDAERWRRIFIALLCWRWIFCTDRYGRCVADSRSKESSRFFKWSLWCLARKWSGGISEAQISILHVHHVIRFEVFSKACSTLQRCNGQIQPGQCSLVWLVLRVQQLLFFSTFVQKFVQKIRVDDRRAHYPCDAGLWNSNGCVSMHLSREFKSFQFGTKIPIVKDH